MSWIVAPIQGAWDIGLSRGLGTGSVKGR